MSTIDIPSLLTIAGLVFTGIGLIYAGVQLRASQKIAKGDFLLRLDEAFWHHYEVHKHLRPGGDWTKSGAGPIDEPNDDWAAVEAYMGLFERVKVLVDGGIIDLGTVSRFYRYRIYNIVANCKIYEVKHLRTQEEWAKMSQKERQSHGWYDFIELWHALENYRQERVGIKTNC